MDAVSLRAATILGYPCLKLAGSQLPETKSNDISSTPHLTRQKLNNKIEICQQETLNHILKVQRFPEIKVSPNFWGFHASQPPAPRQDSPTP